MLSFNDYHTQKQQLDEKLITFGRKAYPKFGQIVILAGGAGSGKGFVYNKLMGIEGKVFDVDELKKMVIKSKKLADKIKSDTGQDMKSFDLRNPEQVSKIHDIIGGVYKIDKKDQKRVISSVLMAPAERKPNLIFDMTLRDINKLHSVSKDALEAGYQKENIHIVWVLNKFEVAAKQNAKRSRVVSDEILLATHEGAALSMKKILDMDKKLMKYMDGDIHIAWNQAGVDSSVELNNKGEVAWFKEANYMTVKKKGKPQLSTSKLNKAVIAKIKEYVPNTEVF